MGKNRMKSEWQEIAKREWDKVAEWIDGDGRFALLAYCRVLTVSLWGSVEEAERAKEEIDKYGCGGYCKNKHQIIDLYIFTPEGLLKKENEELKQRARYAHEEWQRQRQQILDLEKQFKAVKLGRKYWQSRAEATNKELGKERRKKQKLERDNKKLKEQIEVLKEELWHYKEVKTEDSNANSNPSDKELKI